MKYYVTNSKEQMKEYHAEFSADERAEMHLVKMYPDCVKQHMIGFGAAFTEAAAYTYAGMNEEMKAKFLDLCFEETGNGYTFCRTHIQSCDFALGNYAYVEDETDTELATFTLERDHKYIIPMIKDAQKVNPDLTFLASPWSPPAFMKDTKRMNQGGKLLKEHYSTWARIMVKYVVEYEKLGIKISRITVQNEPQATQTWDSCIYTAEEEAVFACEFLKEELTKNNLDVKINVWYHNKDCIIERANGSMSHPKASGSIDGIAYHWYSGDHFEALQEVREQYPDKELIFTEGCVEYSRFATNNQVKNAEMYAHDMIGNLKAGSNGFLDWNILLDETGGPNHVGNFCDAPLMFNTKTGELDVKLSFSYIGHFSRFIKPGARRVLVSTYNAYIESVGFVNSDGEKVLILLNRTDEDQECKICIDKKTTEMKIAAHSIVTAVWK